MRTNAKNKRSDKMMKSLSIMTTFFRNRFVQVIVVSSILLQIGIWVRNFSILLFVMEKTKNNSLAVSMISVAEFAPIFVFSFVGGTLADRWRPKSTMIWCDLLSACSVFITLLTIIFGTWEAVFFVTLISAILSQFSQPSSMKLAKEHIPEEQLETVIAMLQTLMAIFMIIGPILGTMIYQRCGINIAVGIMAVAFLLSAGVLTFLPSDAKSDKEQIITNFWQQLRDGFAYVWKNRVLTILGLVFAIAGLAVGIVQPLGVFIIVERLNLPKENLQWLFTVNGTAMLIGGGLLISFSSKILPQKLLVLGLLANAIAMIGIGLSTKWIFTLTFQFLNGMFMPCIQIGVNTLILKFSEKEFVGRVNGVLNPMFIGFMLVTMSLTGWLKNNFSLAFLYVTSGLLFFTGMIFTALLLNVSISNKIENVV